MVITILLFSCECYAQGGWTSDPGLFLEPNRFSVTKELQDRAMWLSIGFGRPAMTIGVVDIGLEALGWSRLRVLSGFRFPVETADYFFGMYAAWGGYDSYWRFRISHI